MAGETCYWCGAPETSREHVPPRCIFPEAKDTADGVGFRENPITVPSCETHNVAKSKDDEYLLCMLALGIQNNPVGNNQALTKVMRALKRAPRFANLVLGQNQSVLVEDIATGKVEKSVAVEIDDARIDNALEHIARAIYFHHYRRPWSGSVKSVSEFTMNLNTPNAVERNAQFEQLRVGADDIFAKADKHGATPEVFYYQIIEDPGNKEQLLVRLSFYEGTRVTVFMRPTQQGAQADSPAFSGPAA